MRKLLTALFVIYMAGPANAASSCDIAYYSYEYCNEGYYMETTGNDPVNGSFYETNDCKTCPTYRIGKDGAIVQIGSSRGNNTLGIKYCYIPKGTSFIDDNGRGTYKNNCYYK